MKLEITVTVCGRYFRGGAAMEVPESLVEAFNQLDTTTEPLFSSFGTELHNGESHKRVIKLRREAAKEISDALTRVLMNQMAKNDTMNGYPMEPPHD